MNNPTFVHEEDIPIVHQDEEDYDDYRTPDTSKIAEILFIKPDTTEATSILRLRQKVKRDKLIALYRHLNVTAGPDLADIDRFTIKKNTKTGNTDLLFLDGNNQWQSLTNKRTSEFLSAKTLREKFGGLNIMKSVLSLYETPSVLERSVKAASKLESQLSTDLQMESIPLKNLSSLVEEIHVKTQEASQNTDLFDMRQILAIDKALQSMQGELLNKTSKLTEINKRIERDTKKLKGVEDDPTYYDEQRQLYKDRLDDLNTEKQARLEILSQNRKDLQAQVARIKQTLEKVLDNDASLTERIHTLFREQGITIAAILAALSMTVSTIFLAITGVFGGGTSGTGVPPSKDKGTLKK